MNKQTRTNAELLEEISSLKQRIQELEQSESERERAEEALRDSESKYRFLAESATDVVFTLDINLVTTYVSPSIERMLGYTPEERIAQKVDQQLTLKSQKLAFEALVAELDREKEKGSDPDRSQTLELEYYHKDGSIKHLVTYIRGIRDGEGNLTGFYGSNHDITDRKRAEEALRASEELFRSYLEYAPDGIYLSDVAGNFLYGNRKCEEIIGYWREELIGKNFLELNILSENSLNKAAQLLQANIEGKSTGPDQIELISKEGRLIPVEINTSVVQRMGQEIVLAFVRDITDRKRAEEALRESEEKYRWVLDNITDVITVMDMNLRFTYVSPSIMRMRGYTDEEATVQTFEQAMTPESLQIVAKVFEEEMKLEASGTADPGRSRILELEQYRKDGSIVWMENSLSFMRDKAQKPVGIISVSRDITDRKQAKEKLALNFETQAAMNALLGLSLEGRTVKEFLYRALDLVLSLKWLAIEPKGAIFLADKAGEKLHLHVHKGFSKELCAMCSTVPFGRCLCGRAAAARAVQFADRVDERHDTRYEGMPPHGHYCVPILSGDHILGVIILYVQEGHTRSPWEEDFLKAVANSLAGTIERRQAEEDLRKSEERYRTILEDMDEGYFENDLAGNFTFVNDAECRDLGYSREKLIGMNYRQYSDEATAKKLYELFYNIYNTGKPIKRFPGQFASKDGRRHFNEVSASLIRDAKGKPIGFRGISQDVTDRKRAEEELQQTLESLRKAVGTTIQVMVSAVETRDPYTAGHQIRSADLARAIATEMGLPQEKIDGIRMAGSIHDIGKLSIPAEILSKPKKLTEIEFSLIKEHSRSGYEILKDVKSPWPLAEIVYQHHERMDGSGYPRNLKGDDILMEARIMAVADVVESMASHRPYRPALGLNAAMEEIENNKGKLYDSEAVDVCLRLFREKGYQLERTRL